MERYCVWFAKKRIHAQTRTVPFKAVGSRTVNSGDILGNYLSSIGVDPLWQDLGSANTLSLWRPSLRSDYSAGNDKRGDWLRVNLSSAVRRFSRNPVQRWKVEAMGAGGAGRDSVARDEKVIPLTRFA